MFGPGVPVKGPLVVLGRSERQDALPADQRQEGDLLALQELLDEDGIPGQSEPALHEALGEGRLRFLEGMRDDHPFAGGQAVGLDDDRRPMLP